MNKFNDVINIYGNVTKTAIAIGASVQAVCFWRDGKREINPAMCVKIEQVTCGKVTRQDLRPDDWQQIWPELIKAA
jgi:DNA-binding transcriptional regulator YdaS (Cro superfamily)